MRGDENRALQPPPSPAQEHGDEDDEHEDNDRNPPRVHARSVVGEDVTKRRAGSPPPGAAKIAHLSYNPASTPSTTPAANAGASERRTRRISTFSVQCSGRPSRGQVWGFVLACLRCDVHLVLALVHHDNHRHPPRDHEVLLRRFQITDGGVYHGDVVADGLPDRAATPTTVQPLRTAAARQSSSCSLSDVLNSSASSLVRFVGARGVGGTWRRVSSLTCSMREQRCSPSLSRPNQPLLHLDELQQYGEGSYAADGRAAGRMLKCGALVCEPRIDVRMKRQPQVHRYVLQEALNAVLRGEVLI